MGKTTFASNLETAAVHGHVVIYGYTSGPPDPIVPLVLMPRSLSISGGMLGNDTQTREELLWRAREVLSGIRAGWLRLHIAHVLPLAQAAEAHRVLEHRESTGKIILQQEG